MKKQVYTVVLIITILFSICITSFAKNDIKTEIMNPEDMIWQYTVYADETCQEILESGTIPQASARYTWSGITLQNGQTAEFVPSHNRHGLYAEKGTIMTFQWSLNRPASYRALIRGFVFANQYETTRTNSSGFSARWTAPSPDYYRGLLTNQSSDAITITSFSINF